VSDETIKPDEVVPWLSFLAYQADSVGEGELAAALGVDRIAARETILRGAEIAQRVANARATRVSFGISESERLDGLIGQRSYGHGDASIRALFSDGRERSAKEVATTLRIGLDAATARLHRCRGVRRVRLGVWKRVDAEQPDESMKVGDR
jgi:hypothetical protein